MGQFSTCSSRWDVITLIKGGDYENLNLTVGRALEKRPEVSMPCSDCETKTNVV